MVKNKGTRILVTIECQRCPNVFKKRSLGISRYSTTKNRRNSPNRLELKKFCSYCNEHTFHKEIK
uniref:Large ribosomal subunit protein bL33c n=1 Tax=Schizocladia ischiensis TaxID=196139 RepID=A0A7S6U9U7_9STRA|nr:ribosomal protein L33 [Schizocladia ischiensis]QOW07478.1 ribosomal protein L33 [Schizocladia ischiensis]